MEVARQPSLPQDGIRDRQQGLSGKGAEPCSAEFWRAEPGLMRLVREGRGNGGEGLTEQSSPEEGWAAKKYISGALETHVKIKIRNQIRIKESVLPTHCVLRPVTPNLVQAVRENRRNLTSEPPALGPFSFELATYRERKPHTGMAAFHLLLTSTVLAVLEAASLISSEHESISRGVESCFTHVPVCRL